MQPAVVKRKIKQHNPKIKMSANNVRDIVKLFGQKGIVRPVKIGKKAHLRYELTDTGTKLRQLLMHT